MVFRNLRNGAGNPSVADDGPENEKPSLEARAVNEIKKFATITLYLWVLFAAFSLHRTLILQQAHIDYEEHGFAIINALILAKVILIGDDLNLGTRFKDQPLIYTVLWRAALFAVLLICVHIAEKALSAWLHGKPLSDSFAEFGNGGLLDVLAVGAIMFVVLIPFFMFAELGRVLGSKKLWRLLLTRDRASLAPSARVMRGAPAGARPGKPTSDEGNGADARI